MVRNENLVLTRGHARFSDVTEAILANQSSDYYSNKIREIEQDLIDNERGIRILYEKKSVLIDKWAKILEYQGYQLDTICGLICDRLIELDLKRGIKYVYECLPDKYKNKDQSELARRGLKCECHDGDSNDSLIRLGNPSHIKLPHNVSNLGHAPREFLQDNERFIRDLIREWRRRHNEYTTIMHQRNIAMIDDEERDVITTPQPYSPREGYLYQEARKIADILWKFGDTFKQISENIYNYPPQSTTHEVRVPYCNCQQCEAEDQQLAKGLNYWTMYYAYLLDYHRPFSDKKFSQTYVKWFRTEVLNAEHGKHAAAVMSKVVSYKGNERSLTREAVGDSLISLYNKLIEFAGMFEMTIAIANSLPKIWHDRLMVPVIAERKVQLSPVLSDSAFGSEGK